MKKTAERLARLAALAAEGKSATFIAAAIGVSLPTAIAWAAEIGAALPSRLLVLRAAMADPEVRARHKAATRAALADPEVRARHKAARLGARGVEIPPWVRAIALDDEYLEIAARAGEEAAAAQCRRLKREMAPA